MKRIMCVLLVMLCLFACVDAQDIVGRWKGSKKINEQLNIPEEYVRVRYKFRKDSTFYMKVYGDTDLSRHKYSFGRPYSRWIRLSVKGRYEIVDGRITTYVTADNVSSSVDDNGYSVLDRNDFFLLTSKIRFGKVIAQERKRVPRYAVFLLRKVLSDCSFLWDWDNVPITVTKKTLIVEDKISLRK